MDQSFVQDMVYDVWLYSFLISCCICYCLSL